MKKTILLVIFAGLLLASCNQKTTEMKNPLLSTFNTPFGVPPFEEIKVEQFIPAYEEAMKKHSLEVEAITNNPKPPNFRNTIEKLAMSGKLLKQVSSIFNNLNASLTSDKMQEIAQTIAPLTSKHYDDISLNAELFKRVKTVYEDKENITLSIEQQRLLEITFKDFERGGANLSPENQDKLRKINGEMAVLKLKFDENVLAETNNFKLVIDNKDDLSGLPESVIMAAEKTAKENGMENKWVFTTHKPSMLPFLSYADNRDLRKTLHTAYIMRGDNNNEYDNKKILTRIASLSAEKAQLLGFKNYAEYILDKNMAKTPEKVFEFTNKVWDAALPIAKTEAAELQKLIDSE